MASSRITCACVWSSARTSKGSCKVCLINWSAAVGFLLSRNDKDEVKDSFQSESHHLHFPLLSLVKEGESFLLWRDDTLRR